MGGEECGGGEAGGEGGGECLKFPCLFCFFEKSKSGMDGGREGGRVCAPTPLVGRKDY